MTQEEALAENEKLRADQAVLVEQNQALKARIATLEARLEELERQLNQSSKNSSKPPSSDPPWMPPWKKAREEKKRKPRGWGKKRNLLPVEKVDLVQPLYPTDCDGCGAPVSRTHWGSPERHQVTELPVQKAIVTEYQLHHCRCENCGKVAVAKLPDGVSRSSFGPRLQATIAMLSGGYRMSKRQIRSLLDAMWGIDISLGAIIGAERRMSDAIKDRVEEARKHVQKSPAVFADETPWKERHKLGWLWTAGTPKVVTFHVSPSRSGATARELLSEHFNGILVSDRYAAYGFVPMERRQVCWAHLKREFVALAESRTPFSRELGEKTVELIGKMFHLFHAYQRRDCDPAGFLQDMKTIERKIIRLLEAGKRAPHPYVASKCKSILKSKDAFFTFATQADVEPTNNRSERALRHGVLYRKSSLGTQSSAGSRYVERVLTVVHTLKAQARNLFDYLIAAATAHLYGYSAPSLLPAPAFAALATPVVDPAPS